MQTADHADAATDSTEPATDWDLRWRWQVKALSVGMKIAVPKMTWKASASAVREAKASDQPKKARPPKPPAPRKPPRCFGRLRVKHKKAPTVPVG